MFHSVSIKCFILSCVCALSSSNTDQRGKARFVIDYERNDFLLDSKPFRYVSGSMHYFRVPRELWKDRFYKMRYAGLNAVQTYIYWKGHESQDGIYDFDGNLDIEAYFAEASKAGLYVILRLGPYIDAEVDMGGLPFWILSNNPEAKLRTADPSFMKFVDRWFSVLLPKVKKHLVNNGGNILMVQVENEYGSYPACDYEYTSTLRDLVLRHLGADTVLFTTDGNADGYLKCGKIPGAYATVDFGAGSDVKSAFRALRHFEPEGPLVNSEYYTGWLDFWGERHSKADGKLVADSLNQILALNASVNLYVFHGGTSFGFMSGKNKIDKVEKWQSRLANSLDFS